MLPSMFSRTSKDPSAEKAKPKPSSPKVTLHGSTKRIKKLFGGETDSSYLHNPTDSFAVEIMDKKTDYKPRDSNASQMSIESTTRLSNASQADLDVQFEGLPGQKRPAGSGCPQKPRFSSKGRRLTSTETPNEEKIHAALRLRSSKIGEDYNKDAETALQKLKVGDDSSLEKIDSHDERNKRSSMTSRRHLRRNSTRGTMHLGPGWGVGDDHIWGNGNTISMPVSLLSKMMRLLQDNSSESKIHHALNFICKSCALELNCEKVDLFVVSMESMTVVPFCQAVHPESYLGDEIRAKIKMNPQDVEFKKTFRHFFDEMYESKIFRISDGNIWDRIVKGREEVFTSDELTVEELMGKEFMDIVRDFRKVDFDVRNVMAVPVKCTRNREHLVAIILCQNKFAEPDSESDDQGSRDGDNDYGNDNPPLSPPRSKQITHHFDEPTDAIIPKQLSQFAGIAVSHLEMILANKHREDKFQFVIQAVNNLASDESIGTQIKKLYEEIHGHVSSDDLSLYVTARDDQALKLVHSSSNRHGIVPIDDKSLVGVVARTKKPVYVKKETKGKSSTFVNLLESNEFAVICVPVIYQEKVSAVIKASNHQHLLDNDDLDMLTMLGNSTGILLHQSHILKDAMSASRLANAAGRLAKCASSKFSTLTEIMEVVKEDAKILVPCQRVTIYFSDFNRKELWTYLKDLEKNGYPFFKLPLGHGMAGVSAASNEVFVTQDAYKEDIFDRSVDEKTGFRTKSVLCIPIHERGATAGQDAVGVLQIINKVDREGQVVSFIEDDRIILENFASTVGTVLTTKLHDFVNKKFEADAKASPKDLTSMKLLSLSKQYSTIDPKIIEDKHNAFKRSSIELLEKDKTIMNDLLQNNEEQQKQKAIVRTTLHGQDVMVHLPELRAHGMTSWNFNILDFDLQQCQAYVMHMLDQFSILDELGIDVEKTGNYVAKILETYNKVPYHNFHHATQVAHQTGWMLLRSNVNDLAALSMVIAAISHDVDHPGNNNSFEVQMDSDLARLYSYDRVLERHHCATALNILHTEECDMLGTLSASDRMKVKRTFTHAILSTDMNVHTELMAMLEEMSLDSFDAEEAINSDVMNAMASMILHSADLSSNCLTLEQAKKWGTWCTTEFRRQAEKEAENGIEVTPFMTNLDNEKDLARTQFGFCSFVVKPWYKIISSFNIFKEDMSLVMDNLNKVIEYYEKIGYPDLKK